MLDELPRALSDTNLTVRLEAASAVTVYVTSFELIGHWSVAQYQSPLKLACCVCMLMSLTTTTIALISHGHCLKLEGTHRVQSHANDWLRHLANVNEARTTL